jgi:hypothetical protein
MTALAARLAGALIVIAAHVAPAAAADPAPAFTRLLDPAFGQPGPLRAGPLDAPRVDPAPRPAWMSRFRLDVNAAPFAARFLQLPEATRVEPPDSPFDARGQVLPQDAPFGPAAWRPANDLDLAAAVQLDARHGMMVGFAFAARGRFTPPATEAGAAVPSLLFLQFSRRW